ncbi:MAG TPA: fibronectin type III domain-containing protein [Longimicrobiaceae bacterium]
MRFEARKALALAAAALVAGAAAACDGSSTGSDALTPPLGLTATATGATSIRLTWNQVPTATGYEVERAPAGGAFASVASAVGGTFYDDASLQPSTAYRYRVRATNGTRSSDYSTEATASTGTAGPRVRVLNGAIAASTTLYAETTYVLSGYVKVQNGATLTIQPGTTIVGDTLAPGSSLWILRGAKIDAVGTASSPIVFTSQRAAGNRRPGDWGGIIIVGNGLVNRTANPILTEGPANISENYAGGTNFNDNSGRMKYVRIEFAGYDVSNGGGQELNSLSMYAVGRGTTIEYVQSMAGLDDSFEWFGGAVDGRYLVSYESGDDHFDWTEGYAGRNQFLIALQTTVLQPRPGTGTVSSDPRGFEGDGCENNKPGCTYANAPYSMPVFANFTVIGPGAGVFTPADGNGAVVRRGSGGTLVNGVIGRWPGYALSMRDAESDALRAVDSLMVRNVLLVDNGNTFEVNSAACAICLTQNLNNPAYDITTTTGVTALFAGLPSQPNAPTAGTLDWTPAAGSALATGGMASFTGTPIAGRVTNYFGGTLTATAYRGAADPAGPKWWQGWTVYYRN